VSSKKVRKLILDIRDEDRFSLSPAFMADYEGKQPSWSVLAYITYLRTYSRPLEDGKSEEFWQTCQRVVNGTFTIQKHHCRKNHLPWSDRKAQKSAQEMFKLMWEFKFLPPGRGLWMMGTEYVEKFGGMALNNCAFVSTKEIDDDFAAPFTFLMDASMLGVGVGGDMEGAGKVTVQQPVISLETFVVEDSREGWVALAERVLLAFVGQALLPKEVDYSQVRPEGSDIKGFGGTASGPGPLKDLYESIQRILTPLIGQTITTEAIADLFNVIGRCVVAGNVRRSAEILLGNPGDAAFAALKDPTQLNELIAKLAAVDASLNDDLTMGHIEKKLQLERAKLQAEIEGHPLRTHRWASNNSLKAVVGMDYTTPAEATALNGEPGYFWLDNARRFGRMKDPATNADKRAVGTNPCSEQTLESFETCCLVETFPSKVSGYEEYERVLKYAYLYAKTVTLVPTHSKRTNAVMMRNRRIGASQSGIVQSIAKHGQRQHFQMCDQGYTYLQDLDTIYSDWLCIPKSIKTTSVKPSGTVSLLAGTTPGIHFDHAEFYYRTIRISDHSPLLAALRKAGYRLEKDLYTPSTTVAYFPIHADHFDRSKSDVSMWEQLELVAQMQYYWADNQVSASVTFKPEEAKDIKYALELYETRLKSISFLPLLEHGYAQAPYITITKDEYELATKDLQPFEFGQAVHEVTEKFCDGAACEVQFGPK
jgi:adenosylcobalamin-dependent ribonucleoside-triphosphate reductase